jgi:hypothetical protein
MRDVMSSDFVSSAICNTATKATLLGEKERQATVIRLLERLGIDVTTAAPWDGQTAPKGSHP